MATGSKEAISIDLKLPIKWEDLNNPLTFGKKKTRFSFCSHSTADLADKELRYVFALLAQGFTATEVKTYCLHRWAGLKVLHRYGNLWACKHEGLNVVLAAEQVERATHALDWLDSVPTLPVRLAKLARTVQSTRSFKACRLRRSSCAITSIKVISPRSRTTCSMNLPHTSMTRSASSSTKPSASVCSIGLPRSKHSSPKCSNISSSRLTTRAMPMAICLNRSSRSLRRCKTPSTPKSGL